MSKREKKKEITPIKEMKPERLLGILDQQLRILDRVLACRPTGMAKNDRLVLVSLYQMVKETKIIDDLVMFYGWCKDMGIGSSSEYPEVNKITENLLGTLGEFLARNDE
ncbi:hypothetical protein OIU77_029915 [Salix suchowensis]|uniref:AP180 N-terminal homology (ANTH) domain-containing protein n=1 Tax=Salix suchowensis TaxID=1278906 RepID=A0ABQ9BCP7_9ROSI|nr:hypothetical protein OIU77_029915 [Salix suchowensis]